MALYTQLPVFKKSYDLLLNLLTVSTTLPKSYRYSFGERLQKETIEMIINIYKSNTTPNKIDFITKSRDHLEVTRLLIRILYDARQISLGKMVFLNSLIEDISRQLVGWQKYSTHS